MALLHAAFSRWLADQLSDFDLALAAPARMEVVYVRDMEAAAAPVAAPAAPAVLALPPPVFAAVSPPAEAASAPEEAASQPKPKPKPKRKPEDKPPPTAEPLDTAMAPIAAAQAEPQAASGVATADAATQAAASSAASMSVGEAPSPPEAAVAAVAQADSVAPAAQATAPSGADSAAPPFEWPVSTRMSYRLTGNVRGEVAGDAQVEWVRMGTRYQVHLDITLGLQIAPLMTRRMSSDGEITPEGLSPRRYDQDTKIGFGTRQRVAVLFEPATVVLANGQRRERPAGVQDTASQFIQLTYLFTTRPELLRSGAALEVPLALPRNISSWVYDVIGDEPVYTPIGTIDTVHLKPRRTVAKSGDLSAEIWFAPQLRYLPVRIRIQQDVDTFIDLVIDRKPQIAAP